MTIISPRPSLHCSQEVIDRDGRYHHLAGSEDSSTEQRLLRFTEPICNLGSIEKLLTCPFLSAAYEVGLLSGKICRRYPCHELVVLRMVLVLPYRYKSRFYSGNVSE
jgi:hypothetical protein